MSDNERVKQIIAERALRRKKLNVESYADEASDERISDRKAERSIDVLVKAERIKEERMRELDERQKERKKQELEESKEQKDICFIGYGKMARALAKGIISCNPEIKMIASDVSLGYMSERKIDGVLLVQDNTAAVKQSKYVFLAVKPMDLESVMVEIAPSLTHNHIIVSILAGTQTDKIKRFLAPHSRVCRVMPNLAATVSKSMSALAFNGNFSDAEQAFIVEIFKSIGKMVIVDESKMNAITAVSGSGTAYVFKFMQTFIDAGIQLGLSAEEAKLLVFETVEGALALGDTAPLATLIANVSSPNGTTIEALRVFDKRGLAEIVSDAVTAAHNRSEEMEKE